MYAHTAYNGYLALRKSVLHSVCYLPSASHSTVSTVKACTCPTGVNVNERVGTGAGTRWVDMWCKARAHEGAGVLSTRSSRTRHLCWATCICVAVV